MRTWSIAELADEFGVTHRTIRFYEDRGLLAPERQGTRRVYRARDRVRLALVLRGKRLGFDLAEIARIVDMYDQEPARRGSCATCSSRSSAGGASSSSAAATSRSPSASSTKSSAAAERRWRAGDLE